MNAGETIESRPLTEEGVKRYWPLAVTVVLIAGNYFVMKSQVEDLKVAQAKTQADIQDLSKAFYEMRGAFNERNGGGK